MSGYPPSVLSGVSAVGTLFAAGTPVTTTAAETQAAVISIPANFIALGSVLRLTYQGIQTAVNATDSITIRVRMGATTLTGTPILTGAGPAGVVNGVFAGRIVLTGRGAPGSAAAIVGFSTFNEPTVAGAITEKLSVLSSTNFATNAAMLLELTIQFGSANAGNSARVDNYILEAIP